MTPWIEPTPRVRWGDARWRYGVGLVTIMLGVALSNLTSTFSLWFALLGPGVQLLGWLILPGALWRRLLVTLPCLVAALVLIAGPDFAGAFVVLLAGWLFARHRPGLSYLALVPVIAVSFVLKAALNEYGQNWIGLVSGALACVAAAWLGRALALRRHRLRSQRMRAQRMRQAEWTVTSGEPGPAVAAAEPAFSRGPAVPAGRAASAIDRTADPE